jgi:PTH2 family peptidyl-tRNA hydrolase
MREPKQVIIVRRDLCMPPGKLAAQVAHASMGFLLTRLEKDLRHYPASHRVAELSDSQLDWMGGSFAKVVLEVNSLEEFSAICQEADEAGLNVYAIQDEGRTVLKGKNWTAAAIGPDDPEKINKVTGHLKLY